MNKSFLLAVFTFAITLYGVSQNKFLLDSLSLIANNNTCLEPCVADTLRIDAYLDMGEQLIFPDPDSTLKIELRIKELSENLISKFPDTRIETKGKEYLGTAYSNIAYIYRERGEIPQAISYYKNSTDLFKSIDYKEGVGTNIYNLSVIYRQQGRTSEALSNIHKAIIIQNATGNKRGESNSINDLGVIYYNKGDIKKALEYFNKSLVIREEINYKPGIAVSYNNLGFIHRSQGNYTKALEYYDKSMILNKESGFKEGMADIYHNKADIYNTEKQFEKALENLNKALALREEIGQKEGIAQSYNNIGYLYDNRGLNDKALEFYNKSLKLRKEINDKKGIIGTLINLSNLYFKQSDYSKSVLYAEEAYLISQKIDYPIEIKKSAATLRDINIHQEQYLQADTLALQVVDINNAFIISNFFTLSEKGQEQYFNKVVKDYMKFNSYALLRKDDNPNIIDIVFNNTIKNKGVLLKSSTAMRSAVLNSKDSILIDKYYKWIHLKKKISKQYARGQETKVLEAQSNIFEKELVKDSQGFSDFGKLKEMDWKSIQNSLKENEVALEFIHFKFKNYKSPNFRDFTDTVQYCALVLTKNSKHPEMIPLFEEKQLEQIIGKFGGNNYSYINSIYGKNTEVNKALYNLIWAPMEASLKGVKKIFISPDGLLHKISFSAIAKEQNVYLCDAYDIEVKSSTGKISEQEKQNQQMNTATLFGGITYDTDSTTQKVWSYLEGTKTETQKVDKILQKGHIRVDYYSNTFATEEEFKLMASKSNILHIATHGFFYPDPKEVQESHRQVQNTKEVEYGDIVFRGGSRGFGVNSFVENDNPLMRSGLVFAGANNVWSQQNKNDSIDDGVLTAQEVSNIDMRKTELVVMSACETGLGDIKGSEGVYGLQRAFKMAGVDYMIMSLWQVPDKETEEFMTSFYQKLIKSRNIKEAFASTQKEMRDKYDPYFWAAFVLIE